jgi:hypothetical protein
MKSDHKIGFNISQEAPLEPGLPICDSHHHLLDTYDNYLLEDLLKDISGGHNVIKTVAIECDCKYRKSGPVPLRPIGETEFLVKIDSQNQGIEVAAGIVGFADLALGDAVAPVLEAHLEA